MSSRDAERWNNRYLHSAIPADIGTPEIVSFALADVDGAHRVLDVACGFGDAGLALASRGCEVTFVDVSQVALDAVTERAKAESFDVQTVLADLDSESLPDGGWDIIICLHYLDRRLLASLADHLAPNGRVVIAIATQTNLERHERPSARFLLDAGELATLLPDLRVIHHDELWRSNGAHEAWLVAVPG